MASVITLAGSGEEGFRDGVGAAAQFECPIGIAADGEGNCFVADFENNRIRKINPGGGVTTLGGSGVSGFAEPRGVAVDDEGNCYVADPENHSIRKVDRAGSVTTLAGSGEQGFVLVNPAPFAHYFPNMCI